MTGSERRDKIIATMQENRMPVPGKELASLNDVPGDVDIIDLCIRPEEGLRLLQENQKPCKCVVLQPGAESPELIAWLEEHQVPYVQNCLLVGMQTYPRKAE